MPVSGKLVKGGEPYAPPAGQLVNVTFIGPEAEAGSKTPTAKDPSAKATADGAVPYLAKFDQATGAFTISGPDGKGIPPGKYRVAVTQKMTREAFDAAYPKPVRGVARDDDMLKNAFAPETSTIIREVKAPGEVLVIDLEKEKPKEATKPAASQTID